MEIISPTVTFKKKQRVMNINRNNYEQVLVDYFDGRLGPVETACLMAFLEENPDLKEEFESFENITLDAAVNIGFQDKDQLKRTIIPEQELITEENYLKVFLDDAEGTLDVRMKEPLDAFLHKNPSLVREYYSWRHAHLLPESLIFDRKARLKRSLILPMFRREFDFVGLAAALIVLFVAGALLMRSEQQPGQPALSFETTHPAAKPRNVIEVPDQSMPASSYQQNDLLASQHPSTVEKNHPDQTEPIVARLDLPVDKMPAGSAAQELASLNSGVPDGIEGYQNRYTEILALIEVRRQLDKQGGDNNPANDENAGRSRFTFWDLAALGVAGYNAFADKDIPYTRRTGNDGRTSAFSLGMFAYEKK